MKNSIFAIVTAIVSILIVFALFELYVRIFEADGSNYDIEMWRYAKDLKRVSNIPGVGHEHIPGKSGIYMGVPVTINSVGWRDREYSLEKENSVKRIMMLGDSLTFGWGAAPEDVTSYKLEEILNSKPGSNYEVLNTGVGNTNTAMQVAYFTNIGYRYNPDIVVLNYFFNDAEETPERKNNFLIERFYAAVFISARYDIFMRLFFGRGTWKEYYHELYKENRPGWLAAKASIGKLSDFCKKRDIKLVLVNYPELHELSPYPFHNITNLLHAEAKKNNIPFLDLLPSVQGADPRSLWVTVTDAHPNGKAAEFYAEAIMRFLKDKYPAEF